MIIDLSKARSFFLSALMFSASCSAQSGAVLSCAGVEHGSNYSAKLSLEGEKVIGFDYGSVNGKSQGECGISATEGQTENNGIRHSDWKRLKNSVTVEIFEIYQPQGSLAKQFDRYDPGWKDKKHGIATVEIRNERKGYRVKIMESEGAICSATAEIPQAIFVPKDGEKCALSNN